MRACCTMPAFVSYIVAMSWAAVPPPSMPLLSSRERVSCEYHWLPGTQRLRCASMLSPCGSLVFAGGASGSVTVWTADTGMSAHDTSIFLRRRTLSCLPWLQVKFCTASPLCLCASRPRLWPTTLNNTWLPFLRLAPTSPSSSWPQTPFRPHLLPLPLHPFNSGCS